MLGLESVYKNHHAKRGQSFAILQDERGAFLRKHIGTGKNILDIGCRDGQLTSTYNNGNVVTGADIDSDALARAKASIGIDTVHVDLNGVWPFAPKHYDVVVACEFLEHIYFPDVVVGKIKEVLKDDGMLIGTVPHAFSIQSRIKFLLGSKRGTPLEDPTHINHFTHKEFKGILEKHFIEVEVVGWTPSRYRMFEKLFPLAFAHDLFFVAKSKK